jgi:hypothetical protein
MALSKTNKKSSVSESPTDIEQRGRQSTYWSCWGDGWSEQHFLKVPHDLPRVLSILGFGHAEIVAVQGVFINVRQGTTRATVSHHTVAQYACCNPRTARRALEKMEAMGMVVKRKGACSFYPNTYDLKGFTDTLKATLDTLDVVQEKQEDDTEENGDSDDNR